MSENRMPWTAYWSETPHVRLASSTVSTFNHMWRHFHPSWTTVSASFSHLHIACAHLLARLFHFAVFLRHSTLHVLRYAGITNQPFIMPIHLTRFTLWQRSSHRMHLSTHRLLHMYIYVIFYEVTVLRKVTAPSRWVHGLYTYRIFTFVCLCILHLHMYIYVIFYEVTVSSSGSFYGAPFSFRRCLPSSLHLKRFTLWIELA